MPPGCWPRRSGCRFCRAGQWDVRHRRACACRAPTCDPDAGRCLAAGPAGARRCRPGAAWVSRRGRCSGRGRWQGLSAGVIAGPTTWLLLQQAAHQLQAVSADDNQVRTRRQAAQLQLVCLPTGQRVGLHHPASHINQGYVEAISCSLRQRCGVLVRKSCSFSKSLATHNDQIKIVIDDYNRNIILD